MGLKRPRTLRIRVTDDEHEDITWAARNAGLSTNEYCVQRLMCDGFDDLFKVNNQGEVCRQQTTQQK